MKTDGKNGGAAQRIATRGAVLLSFVVALEFVIMISPFAFVFYAAMNPFLLVLNQSALTRWLTAFFLPHMVVPPNAFLKTVRVLGSVAFLGGMAVFILCALQVYIGKLLRPAVANRGLYAFIRHPQYLALAIAAWGLAVMWPRFLTLTLFAVMLFLYIMQGMIADTGPEWKLFQHHRTFRMIAEYIIHPFAHVAGGHQHTAGMVHRDPSLHNSPMMKRRIIFLDLTDGQRPFSVPTDDFGINVRRIPLFFVDVHLHTGEVLQMRDLASGSGWGTVPTPMF